MHEMSLMNNLMSQLQSLAHEHRAERVTALKVKMGALSHISKEHFLEHFVHAAQGTLAEGAKVEVEMLNDENDPLAQDIVLDEFEIAYAK